MTAPVIIGGGHNGLAAAFYLAKAGLKPIVFERREVVGGGAITGELEAGFSCPRLSHSVSIRADIARDMQLDAQGLDVAASEVEVFVPTADGPVVLYQDAQRSAQALRKHSAKDGERYLDYRVTIERVSSVLTSLLDSAPPSINIPTAGDAWHLLKTGRKFRALGRTDGYRLLRWAPMAAADLVGEWFESDALRAVLTAPAVSGGMLGPRSAGSGLVLLLHEANAALNGRSWHVRNGPGALTRAMAASARAAGAEIRTACPVEQVLVADNRVTGIVAGGARIPASDVISAINPKTTFLDLIDRIDLPPDFIRKIRNYRAQGTLAKVNLALSALPSFGVSPEDSGALSGRIHIGPEIDYIEHAFDHAKYGQMSENPWLDVRIPSILDPGLAPPGAHVMSIYAHYAPYHLRGSTWEASKDIFFRCVLSTLERCAPGISGLVVAHEILTPHDLEKEFGFNGGHIFHGELAIDQLFMMRPLIGYGRYTSPVDGLYHCGGGSHPGGLMSGAAGKFAAQEVLKTSERH
jgi:phytoene dehydrogenase-like protein